MVRYRRGIGKIQAGSSQKHTQGRAYGIWGLCVFYVVNRTEPTPRCAPIPLVSKPGLNIYLSAYIYLSIYLSI